MFMERLQLFFGCSLRSPDPAQHHFDQLVAATHARLAQQGEQQRVPFARLRNIEKVADFQGCGFGSKLAELGMGHTSQQQIRID